jgi:alkylation response protein AidB-like acyl-CoA dehydrogenase
MTSTLQAGERRHDPETFRTEAERWLRASVPEYWRKNRASLSEEEEVRIRGEWDRQLWRGGYAGLSLAKEYGGQGLGLAEEVVFHELAARAQAPDSLGRIGKILTAPTLIAHGTEDQRSRLLPPILSGEHVWCQGFSEPGSGSDLASVACRARRVDGGSVVCGRKTWTSYSRHAQRCLLLAQADLDAPRHHNLVMLLLDMKSPGITLSPIRQISGSSHFSETFFDDVFVPDRDRLGGHGEGWQMAMTVLANERGAIEGATRYVEIRADMDLLMNCCAAGFDDRSAIAALDTRVELIRWQVRKTVARQHDERAFLRAASILKVTWSELWQDIMTIAARTQCPDHRAHWRHQYLEVRSATIYSGTSEIQRNVIADRVLGLPR